MFDRHGLRVSMQKTEVIYVEQQNKDLDILLGEKTPKQRDSFVYLGVAVCRNGGTETDNRRRIQYGANVWRKAERVIGGM